MPALLGISACGWLLVIVMRQPGANFSTLCGGNSGFSWAMDDFRLRLALTPPAAEAVRWLAMMLAMTPLLLQGPVWRLWTGSLARRRLGSIGLFVFGYATVWMVAGVVLQFAAILLSEILSGWAFPGAVCLAVGWWFTPTRRRVQARCHRAPRLRVFGLAAWSDSLAYGFGYGGWCTLACWPQMLLPLTAAGAHLPVMVVVALTMLIDRHAPPTARIGAPRARRCPTLPLRGPTSLGLHSIGACAKRDALKRIGV